MWVMPLPSGVHAMCATLHVRKLECTWPLSTRSTLYSRKRPSRKSRRWSPTMTLLLCGNTTYMGRCCSTTSHGVAHRSTACNVACTARKRWAHTSSKLPGSAAAVGTHVQQATGRRSGRATLPHAWRLRHKYVCAGDSGHAGERGQAGEGGHERLYDAGPNKINLP
eukprot:356944-Chlamydomonas_euryale.AAC.1